MCAPVVMAAMAVAGGMQAYGQYKQGVAANKYYQSVADAQEQQAQIEYQRGEKQSTLIQDSAKYKGKSQAEKAAMVSSSQRAALVANGIDLSSVTSQDLASETMSKAKMDELAIRYDADINSWNTMEDAKYKRWALNVQAGQSRASGKNALSAGKMQAFTTLASTAVSMASVGMLAGGGTTVTPGQGGYGINTPSGVKNMGTWSKF